MKIYGAGMAGLLAGNVLRRFSPTILEAQSELPNNHAALLRFRSDIASRATNIPFKKVQVQKLIDVGGEIFDRPNLKFTNMYSEKVTNKIMGRSIDNLDPVERWIAPPYFINSMANGLDIQYDCTLTSSEFKELDFSEPSITTIPMNIMMGIVNWPEQPQFNFNNIWSVWGEIKEPEINIYQTVYYPHPDDPYYRISISGNIMIAEFIREPDGNSNEQILCALENSFGFVRDILFTNLQIKKQKYGKLLPINDKLRKEFIIYLTDKYKIYSLGRFATWRQILLDDIVKDVQIIEQMVEYRDDYNRKLLANGVK